MLKKVTRTTKSTEETSLVAKDLIESFGPVEDRAFVVALSGDLGAGKTTLVQAIAKELGIKDVVISPTFILAKTYNIKKSEFYKKLIHIDAYRFEDPKEANVLKLEELINDPQNLIVIEWPERLGKSLKSTVRVVCKSVSENTKKITW
jgi:tRNA threonylcarbamoyladenosine biosynthesis protein TsaE